LFRLSATKPLSTRLGFNQQYGAERVLAAARGAARILAASSVVNVGANKIPPTDGRLCAADRDFAVRAIHRQRVISQSSGVAHLRRPARAGRSVARVIEAPRPVSGERRLYPVLLKIAPESQPGRSRRTVVSHRALAAGSTA